MNADSTACIDTGCVEGEYNCIDSEDDTYVVCTTTDLKAWGIGEFTDCEYNPPGDCTQLDGSTFDPALAEDVFCKCGVDKFISADRTKCLSSCAINYFECSNMHHDDYKACAIEN